jgi:DNA-binding winged helix-turn-helix (wHTH) protein/WD40 repeat protein
MEKGTNANGRVRTGLFEIDLNSREVHKSGRRVSLQDQPFRVLAMLLERPGQLVTREELQARLWPSDTYVAFDEGLNTAIRKLRAALGDSAANPRFIETISKRGYRFIAPVSYEETEEAGGVATSPLLQVAAAPQSTAAVAVPLARSSAASESATGTKRSLSVRWLATVLAVAVLLFVAWFARPSLPPPRVLEIRQLTRLGNVKRPIFTDGPRIYFGTGSMGFHDRSRAVSIEGGESVLVPELGPDAEIRSVSPNGSEFLVKTGTGLDGPFLFWKFSLPSRSAQRLGTVVGNYAAWSPDGETIAFTDKNGLNLVKSDGSGVRQLVATSDEASLPVWSPDGRRIRWTAARLLTDSMLSRTFEETDVATGATHPLQFGHAPQTAVGWTRNGDYFIFTAKESGIVSIWAVREAPAGLRQADHQPVRLTAGPLHFFQPIIGKDGKTLYAMGSQPHGELVRYDERSRRFEPFLGGLAGDQVSFSPDGEWLAYVAFPERTLWRCRANRKDCLQLSLGDMQVARPRWSPDGKQIAFNSVNEGEMARGYLIAASGGAPQPLLAESNTGQEGLTWSPEGGRVMFTEASISSPSRIRIVDLKSRQIADVPGSSGRAGAVWSPDGRYIAARNTDDNLELFDFQTGRWSRLAPLASSMTWSLDSQFVYFNTLAHWPRTPQANPGFFRLRIRDGKTEKIFGMPDIPITGLWGIAISVAPDGSPVLLKNAGTSDLYAIDLDLP